MSTSEQDKYNNTAVLFKSLPKNGRTPTYNYNGNAKVNGIEYVIFGWIKQSKIEGGPKYILMSFKRKDMKTDHK